MCYELKTCLLGKPNKVQRALSVLQTFESLNKPRVDVQFKLRKAALNRFRHVKFADSDQVNVEEEEHYLATRVHLPKDAPDGAENLVRDEKVPTLEQKKIGFMSVIKRQITILSEYDFQKHKEKIEKEK